MAVGVFGGPCVEGHKAVIYDRGGMRRIGPLLDLSYVSWERLRDNVSEATVRVIGAACQEQKDFLNSLSTHRHELVIFRGGERVWEGPLHRIGWFTNSVEIVAHDVFEYVMNTPLTRTWSNAYPNEGLVSTRIGEILEYELTHGRTQIENGVTVDIPAWEEIEPPVNLVEYVNIHHFLNEVSTSLVTHPYTMTVGEHIQSLAQYQGVDFTALGRAIHIWDVSRALGRTKQLTESNFLADVIVTEYGADHAQSAYVVGNPPPDSKVPTYGSAVRTENLDYYGPWTSIYTPYNEDGSAQPTQPELNSQALRNLAGRTPAPVEVRIPDNSAVLLSDAIGIEDLVPGVQIPLRATLSTRTVSQMQKIDRVRVIETPGDGEQILLTLVPTTRPDADEELPLPEDNVQSSFSGNANYKLTVSASTLGDSVLLKARVRLQGWFKPIWNSDTNTWTYAGVQGSNQPWSATQEISIEGDQTKTGDWDYDFRFAPEKTALIAQFDNVGGGFRDFTVTVAMGSGIGSATVSGTVEVG